MIVRKEFITLSELIGFVGVEKYDLILYLSSLLSVMDNKILLIDNSETEALTCCIPVPSALNPKVSKVTFGNIDFLKENNPSNYKEKYDYIMVDYGFKAAHKDIASCDKLFFVTDTQQHNIDKINRLKTIETESFLILKDLCWRDKAESIRQSISLPVKDYYSLEYDETDRANMIELQYSEKVSLRKISPEYKEIIQKIMTDILKKDHKQYGVAFKILKKGA